MIALQRLLGAVVAVLAAGLVVLIALGATGTIRSPRPAATFAGPPASVPQPSGEQGSLVLAHAHGRIDEVGTYVAVAQAAVRTRTGTLFIAMRCSGAGRVTVKVGPEATWIDCRGGETRTGTGAFVGVGRGPLTWHVGESGRIAWAVTLGEG